MEKKHLIQLIEFLRKLDGSWSDEGFNDGYHQALEDVMDEVLKYPNSGWKAITYDKT